MCESRIDISNNKRTMQNVTRDVHEDIRRNRFTIGIIDKENNNYELITSEDNSKDDRTVGWYAHDKSIISIGSVYEEDRKGVGHPECKTIHVVSHNVFEKAIRSAQDLDRRNYQIKV